ncbi:MAG: S24/S26 family peptidase [Bacilli bacterium]|nr:S24/S26 family peptidase [Bacilli bacterium]
MNSVRDKIMEILGIIKANIKYVAYGFLVLLIMLSVYTFVVTDIMKKDYVNIFGYSYFVVATGSMSGTIEVNDIIFVRLTDNVKNNDIISYKNKNGDIITHRIIQTSGNRIITKGDANNTQDDAITRNSVIGKVVGIISPKTILEFIAVLLIIVIGVALLNFDKIFKKYIVKEGEEKVVHDFDKEVLPQDVFSSPKDRKNYEHSGLTITIPLKEIEDIKKIQEVEVLDNDGIEVLQEEEVLDIESNNIVTITNSQRDKEIELIEQINNLLRVKNNSIDTSRINKKWLTKYQYIYKLANIIYLGDTKSLFENVEHPSFKEIYDYDLEKIGLYENLRNKIYEMPIYVFLRILVLAIIYNDEAFFDGIFKIMKYKIMIDKEDHFRVIKKGDGYSKKQIKNIMSFMKKISKKYDNNDIFELDKIERLAKIKNYVNE